MHHCTINITIPPKETTEFLAMEPPRMWWLRVPGLPHRMLAVEWGPNMPSSCKIWKEGGDSSKLSMTVSSDHPWPAALRAPIRALREVDESIHHIGWFIDDANSITAFGIGSNNQQKKKALQLAYALCMPGEFAQRYTRNAPTLWVDPSDCISDDYVPVGSQESIQAYAVAQHRKTK